jgi:predicted negative regulator of RcsB-dependent stress response
MKKERNYQPVLVVLVLIVIGVAAWNLFTDWQNRQAETTRQQEGQEWRQRAETLSKKVAELETELKTSIGRSSPFSATWTAGTT